jgi:KaiC/GvpD/RAD55 family RecA-like ATPase
MTKFEPEGVFFTSAKNGIPENNISKNVPIEISEAFQQKDIGYSILIKGEAGAGKSTLALTLLSVLTDLEPIYISTRVAPSSLFSQFPWIKGRLKEENIIDATRTYLPPIGDTKELKTHVLRTIRFSDAPEFLKIIYERIEKYENVVVVIDSWDAIISSTKERNQEWENMFTEFTRQMHIKLILISESSEKTFLDYIVDGIVTLKDSEMDGRILREIEINKTRGIQRRQKRYHYTLNNNKFNYCSSYHENQNEIGLKSSLKTSKQSQPIEFDKSNLYSTGTSGIDNLYNGGLRTSTLNLWEIESDVPLSSFSNIMIPLICNFVSRDFGTIIFSTDGLNSRFVDKNKLFPQLNTEQISQYVRYLVEKNADMPSNSNDIRPYVIPISLSEFSMKKTFAKIYSELAEKTSYKPILSLFSYDFLALAGDLTQYSEELANHLKIVRNYNVIEIGIVNQVNGMQGKVSKHIQRDNLIDEISYFFDTHMKLIMANNALFVYGIKPYSGIYWLQMIDENGKSSPTIKLIPMV